MPVLANQIPPASRRYNHKHGQIGTRYWAEAVFHHRDTILAAPLSRLAWQGRCKTCQLNGAGLNGGCEERFHGIAARVKQS
jgi:hypothetical protein